MKVEMNTNLKNCILQLVVLTILAVITVTKAKFDCNKPPPFLHTIECCQIPAIVTDDIKEKCEVFMKPPGGSSGGNPDCFYSCVVNETGILIDNELQETILKSYLSNITKDTKIIDVLGNKYVECFEEMKRMLENFKENPPSGHGPSIDSCSPHGGMLMNCAFFKTFKECPESVWTNTTECNSSRAYIFECEIRS